MSTLYILVQPSVRLQEAPFGSEWDFSAQHDGGLGKRKNRGRSGIFENLSAEWDVLVPAAVCPCSRLVSVRQPRMVVSLPAVGAEGEIGVGVGFLLAFAGSMPLVDVPRQCAVPGVS